MATRDRSGSYAMVYTPLGQPVTVNLEILSGAQVRAWWYDTRHGTATEIGTFSRQGNRAFTPPIHGKGNDWVLVLDDADRGFAAPGHVNDSTGK